MAELIFPDAKLPSNWADLLARAEAFAAAMSRIGCEGPMLRVECEQWGPL